MSKYIYKYQRKNYESIMQDDLSYCIECGSTINLTRHHALFGRGLRELADADGLVVAMCLPCHDSLHRLNPPMANKYKQLAQQAWEREHGTRDQFRQRYGRSYIQED